MAQFSFLPEFIPSKGVPAKHSFVRTYRATSRASIDELWTKITDLADVSWHPLISSTNVPYGLTVKPGLIYQAVTRLIPIPIKIFVENVTPKEVYCIRVLGMPGLEEKVTYQLHSTVYGAFVSYSVTLKGWLAPLVWVLTRSSLAQVVLNLVRAVEDTRFLSVVSSAKPHQTTSKKRSLGRDCFDF